VRRLDRLRDGHLSIGKSDGFVGFIGRLQLFPFSVGEGEVERGYRVVDVLRFGRALTKAPMTVGLGFLLEAFVGWLAVKSAVGAVVVVLVLPLLQLLGEQVDVVDDLAVEEPVELLGVDPVGAFDLAVQSWCAGSELDVVDAFVEQVPVEGGTEFGPNCLFAPVRRRRAVWPARGR
jgi:hypothetical protein